ncbi:signal peptidase I [Diaminobutyricimonas sp. LJ205]|uniref:signal peptidase I n=1 Tax=Diaminobutyricimonas sp. LJ205 TaxID=2683590 RepID=UPI001E383011|nr:signal peptidase I [Diaminobutyricimonas sp. LJ205]
MGRRVVEPDTADQNSPVTPDATDLPTVDEPVTAKPTPSAAEPMTSRPTAADAQPTPADAKSAPAEAQAASAKAQANADAEPTLAKTRGILYYLGLGLSGGLFVLMLALAAAVIVVPAATGSVPLTVLTSSMEPTLPPGTLIVVQPVDTADIRIGDAITYQIESGKPEVVTHRVISITSSSDGGTTFVTQGDNNDAPDARPVVPDQVQGRVWYSVPWLGYVNNAVNGENRAWIVPVIAGGLFLYAGYMVASAVVDAAKKRPIGNRELPGE